MNPGSTNAVNSTNNCPADDEMLFNPCASQTNIPRTIQADRKISHTSDTRASVLIRRFSDASETGLPTPSGNNKAASANSCSPSCRIAAKRLTSRQILSDNQLTTNCRKHHAETRTHNANMSMSRQVFAAVNLTRNCTTRDRTNPTNQLHAAQRLALANGTSSIPPRTLSSQARTRCTTRRVHTNCGSETASSKMNTGGAIHSINV